jgi:hypothetical protein
MTELIRTKRDGCFELRSSVWGAFLQSVDDPLANATLEDGALQSFELRDGIIPIPADIWSRWVKLCFHYAKAIQSNTEVSCRLLRHEDDKSQWRLLVPQQAVDSASVRINSFDRAVDIVSGEVIEQYPPAGWVPCGSSHSHSTMQLAQFSSTDDHFELGDPGLHIVISHIDHTKNTYVATASVTANKRRFYLGDPAAVIDLTAADHTYHPAVLDAIQLHRPRPWHLDAIAPTAAPQATGNDKPRLFTDDALWHHDELLADRWPSLRPASAGLGFSNPINSAEDIREIATEAINDCIASGDNEGIDHILHSLRALIHDLNNALYGDDPIADDADADAAATNPSALAARPGAARGLPASDW